MLAGIALSTAPPRIRWTARRRGGRWSRAQYGAAIDVFDGHNDSLTRDDAHRFAAGRDGGHLDLPRARAGGFAGGIFAAFTATPGYEVPDPGEGEVELAEPITQEFASAAVARALGRLIALERAGHVAVARAPGDIEAARERGVLAAVAHIEGAEAIDPGLDALELLYAAGLRSLGPVWSRPNAFAHGVPFAFPSSPDTGPGLTTAGHALVRRCAELGIAVDLSHLNEAGFWDIARSTAAPLIASHSGAHALSPPAATSPTPSSTRSAPPEGLVGIVFAVQFVRPDGRQDADTPLSAIVAHARYVADRIGVEHVALGSDFDGARCPTELGDVTGLPRLLDALRARWFTEAEVEAIAWDNWRGVLEAGAGALKRRRPPRRPEEEGRRDGGRRGRKGEGLPGGGAEPGGGGARRLANDRDLERVGGVHGSAGLAADPEGAALHVDGVRVGDVEEGVHLIAWPFMWWVLRWEYFPTAEGPADGCRLANRRRPADLRSTACRTWVI